VSKITKPIVGAVTRATLVLGTRNPIEGDVRSKTAPALGVDVPMPTLFWPKAVTVKHIEKKQIKNLFISLVYFIDEYKSFLTFL
jgi:hypothetical protein